MSRSPREVAERVARMVSGEALSFADMFAADGVLTYPFAAPGTPAELRGRETIREHFAAIADGSGAILDMAGIDSVIRETDDPEVVVAEITHHGRSRITGKPYRIAAVGVIRVRDGEIVHYDDYMDPVALSAALGRTPQLVAALTREG
ncbi:nuclear transport factor 2 family protein [Pseudonocardia sp. CA-107938]|uniref:nuclear transport factor 2 family protein n=1 Tax=Pseudonocardia sp. CA-107938 TaxID=3240021 RepID=UPI003D8C8DA2